MAELLHLLLHIAWVSKVLVVSWETESLFGTVLSWEDINHCVYHYIQIEIFKVRKCCKHRYVFDE